MRSCWVKAIAIVLLAVVLLAGIWLYFNIKYQRMIDAELARIRAEGWPVTAAECAPEPVPNEQNAAVLYQQVFQIDFDAPDPGAGSDLLPDIDYDLIKALREEPTAEIERQVQTLLTDPETTKALQILRQASERPYSVFPIHWEEGVALAFPHYARFRAACMLVSLRALASAREQRIGEALDWCRVGLRMSEHVAAEHTLIAQLVSMAMNSIIIVEPKRFLDTAAVSPQDARQMEFYLRQIDLNEPFTNALAMERAMYLTCEWTVSPIVLWREVWGDVIKVWPDDPVDAVTIAIYWTGVGRPIRKRHILQYLPVMRQIIKLSRQPYRQARAGYAAQEEALADIPASQVLLSKGQAKAEALAAAHRDQSMAEIGLFRVVLGLKAYKYERGVYPDSLEKLKETLDWQLPEDPFTGNDFVYRRQADGFKLYSWGSDLEDDGGIGPLEPPQKLWWGEADIIWECSR